MLTPGTIAACYGTGLVATGISLVTSSLFARPHWSPSHVAILLPDGLWVESTTLCDRVPLGREAPVRGVQIHHDEDRLRDYTTHGRVDWYRPHTDWAFTISESARLRELAYALEGHAYDMAGAGLSGTRFLRLLFMGTTSEMFCSELVAFMLMRLHRLPVSNPGGYTPGGLLRTLIRSGVYEKV